MQPVFNKPSINDYPDEFKPKRWLDGARKFQDSVLELVRPRVDRAAITEMSVGKTAWYTLIAPMIGDPAVTGKSSLDDLNAGKATLLHHIVSTHATSAQRTVLAQVYGRGDCTERDLDQYRELVDAHSARIFANLRALMDKARSPLREVGFRHHLIGRIEGELAPYQLLPALLNESA